MPHRIVGIDIGQNSIKATFAETSFRGFSVVECREVPIPSPKEYSSIDLDIPDVPVQEAKKEEAESFKSLKGSKDINPEPEDDDGKREESPPQPIPAFVYGIAKFISSPGVYFNDAAVAIPGKYVSSRIIELPFSDPKKIDRIIAIEIENYVPFDIEDMVLSYQILESKENSSRLFVSLVKKSDLQTFMEHLALAGLDPAAIGVGGNCIAFAAALADPEPEQERGILHLNADQSELTVMDGNSLIAVRSIPIGYSSTGKANFLSLVQRLKQTLQSIRVEYNIPLKTLNISGLAAGDMSFQEKLAGALDIELSIFSPFLYPFEKTVSDDDATNVVFAKSLGLALSLTVATPKKQINFRIGEFSYKRAGGLFKKEIKKLAVMGGILLLLAFYNLGYSFIKSGREARAIRDQIIEVFSETFPGENVTNPVVQFRQNMELVFKKHKIVGHLGDGNLETIEILKIISDAIPITVVVDMTKIDISQDRVAMEGKTANFEMVDKLEAALNTHKIFKEIKKDSATKTAKGAIKFKFNIRISDKSDSSAMPGLMPKLKGGG